MADYYMEVLAKHCRICAKPLARFKVSYRCGDTGAYPGFTIGGFLAVVHIVHAKTLATTPTFQPHPLIKN